MATTALLTGASPLKLKQGTSLLGRTFRPLPSNPVKLSTAAFSYRRCFAPIIFKNPKPLQCYSLLAQKTTHYLTADSKSSDHTLLSSQCLNVSQDNRPPAANPNIISKLWDKSLEALRKPATAAVVLGLLVMYNPANSAAALAAPAGRFGGSLTSYSSTSYNSSGHSVTTTYNNPYETFYEPIHECGGLAFFVYGSGLGLAVVLMCGLGLHFPRFLNAGLLILWTVLIANWLYSMGQTSVVKLQLQVNSSIMGRAVQMDLNRIGKTVRPYCPYGGLRYLLRDTAVALLRQPDHCISGFSSVVKTNYTRAPALQWFDYLVVREKLRYDVEETVVNEDNTEPQSTTSQRSITDESHNDDVMVTILLAADGEYSKSLTITDSSDVRRVLERLASMDPSKQVFALEVVWTPHLSLNAASKSID